MVKSSNEIGHWVLAVNTLDLERLGIPPALCESCGLRAPMQEVKLGTRNGVELWKWMCDPCYKSWWAVMA